MKNQIIANYVKKVRKAKGLTQNQLACLLGLKRAAVTQYELGRNIPPGDVLLKIQALDPENKAALLQNCYDG